MAAPQRIDIPGVGLVEFPDTMSAEEVNAAAAQLYDGAQPKPSDSGALGLAAVGSGVPAAARALARFGASPTLPKTLGTAGRVIGGLASPIIGAVEGGPLGGLAGAVAAHQASWAGGKTGYFTGRMLQDASRPITRGLARLAPYAQALSTASGAQGALDLAQMADPQRKDLGFLGMATGDPGDPEHPAALNALYDLIRRKLTGR